MHPSSLVIGVRWDSTARTPGDHAANDDDFCNPNATGAWQPSFGLLRAAPAVGVHVDARRVSDAMQSLGPL